MSGKYIARRLLWSTDGFSYYPETIHQLRAELYKLVGLWDMAEAIYRQVLEWHGRIGDEKNMAYVYNKIGEKKIPHRCPGGRAVFPEGL